MNATEREHRRRCPYCYAEEQGISVMALDLGAVELWRWQKEHSEIIGEEAV